MGIWRVWVLWEILKSCGVPLRPPSLMLPVDVLELTIGRKKNFVSQGILDTIDQSRRARLNGTAELFMELRHKTVCALRVDKETYVRGICEGVQHHLWSVILVLLTGEFAHCVPPSPFLGVQQLEWRVVYS